MQGREAELTKAPSLRAYWRPTRHIGFASCGSWKDLESGRRELKKAREACRSRAETVSKPSVSVSYRDRLLMLQKCWAFPCRLLGMEGSVAMK